MPRLKIDNKNAALRGLVAQKLIVYGIHTNSRLAERLSMSYPTFMRKMQNPELFTVGEMRQLFSVLHFNDAERVEALK